MAHHRWSVAKTAMNRAKHLFGGRVTLRDDNAQVGEAMAMIPALNKMMRPDMPEMKRLLEDVTERGGVLSEPHVLNKPP